MMRLGVVRWSRSRLLPGLLCLVLSVGLIHAGQISLALRAELGGPADTGPEYAPALVGDFYVEHAQGLIWVDAGSLVGNLDRIVAGDGSGTVEMRRAILGGQELDDPPMTVDGFPDSSAFRLVGHDPVTALGEIGRAGQPIVGWTDLVSIEIESDPYGMRVRYRVGGDELEFSFDPELSGEDPLVFLEQVGIRINDEAVDVDLARSVSEPGFGTSEALERAMDGLQDRNRFLDRIAGAAAVTERIIEDTLQEATIEDVFVACAGCVGALATHSLAAAAMVIACGVPPATLACVLGLIALGVAKINAIAGCAKCAIAVKKYKEGGGKKKRPKDDEGGDGCPCDLSDPMCECLPVGP